MDTIRKLLWDRKPRLLTDIAQALELLEGSPWSAIHEQHHGPMDYFLKNSEAFELLPMLCEGAFGNVPRYQLSRRRPSALPLPGWENLEVLLSKSAGSDAREGLRRYSDDDDVWA